MRTERSCHAARNGVFAGERLFRWAGDRPSDVKPCAQPTLVRTQHLPPGETPAQGRYGVPDSFPGHAARCHQKRSYAAGRGIYVRWLRADLGLRRGWSERFPRPDPVRWDGGHQASRRAASMHVLATSSPSSRHLAYTRSRTSTLRPARSAARGGGTPAASQSNTAAWRRS